MEWLYQPLQIINQYKHKLKISKKMLSATANLLPIHLYILVFQNLHILISTDDLSIVTNALYLLPMFCQCFTMAY